MTDEELNALEKGLDFSLKIFSKIDEPEEDNEEGLKLNCFYGSFREEQIAGVFESTLVVDTETGGNPAFLILVGGQSLLFAPDDKTVFDKWF